MPRRIMLSVFAVLVTAVTAGAADLPTQSRLGKIFAEPAEARVEVRAAPARDYVGPIIPYSNLPNPVWNRGVYNYGSSWSYYDGGPYYGGPYTPSFVRLPYVCGLLGYCF
jgi:hypothetical protein